MSDAAPLGDRVLVLGTGAMACALGARLSLAGAPVTLSGTWHEAIDAIRARGIVLREASGDQRVAARVEPIDGLADSFTLALVLVKAHQTEAVAPVLARVLAPRGVCLTLQNGLGNREALAAAVGGERVVAGVALWGATSLGPGRVRSFAGRVLLGRPPEPASTRFAHLLGRSSIETEVRDDVDVLLYRKLALNCAVNPLTALHGVPNGEVATRPELREQAVTAAREVGAVAEARGLQLALDVVRDVIDVAARLGENRSSMLQDLARGARTEIDALCGAVVREGRRLGVPTPLNARLWRLVREREGRPLEEEGR